MKMKKLLASALAAAMVISSMVGTLVTSAAETVGTITAGTVNAVVGETDTIIADINIAFPNGVVAPHNIISVALDGYTLSEVALGTVTYADGSAEGVVSIDADGSNLAAGKVLLECPVDSKAPTVTAIALTATFVDADETDTVAGTYAIVVNGEDMTDVDEADIAIDAVNGSLVVAEPHVCVPGEPVDNGDGTHDVPCTGCDKLVVDDEAHTFVDGACSVCGAEEPVTGPVLDETLRFASASLGYGTSSLQIAFRVANTVLDSYADMDIVIIPQKYDTTTFNLVENPDEVVVNKADLVAAGATRKQYYYTDIQLYELGLDINYMLRAYDAEGNFVAYSDTFTTSPAAYLKNSFAASSDAKFRTLVTDTLIVGNEAALNFGKDGSDLANATSVIDGFDISEATASVTTYNTVNDFESYDAEYGTANTDVHQVRTSVQIGKVPFINLRIADTNKVLNLDKLAVTVTYTSKDSTGEIPYEKTFTGAETFTYAGKYINLKFDEVGLHDGDKDILFAVSYDGTPVCDLTYSIETYLGANMTSTIGNLATALIKLGGSFRAYAVK